MSLVFPERSGSNGDDNRLSFDIGTFAFLSDAYGVMYFECGNPLLYQDFYNEYQGGLNTISYLFGNRNSASPGYASIGFVLWGDDQGAAEAERFRLRVRPNGGLQNELIIYSETVTHDNCESIAVVRDNGSYAIHLIARDGTVTPGPFTLHRVDSAGLSLRSGERVACLGGLASTATSSQGSTMWRAQLGNFIGVHSATPFSNVNQSLTNLAQGVDPVTEFGASQVVAWRTLADISAASLSPEPTATSDTLPVLTTDPSNQIVVGSPISPVDPTVSVSVNEKKRNVFGLRANENLVDFEVDGTAIGSTGAVIGRLLSYPSLAVVQDWQTLDAAPTTTWSGKFYNVAPGEYCIEVYPENAPANVYEGRNIWAAAYPMILFSQSQGQIAFNARSNIYTLSTPDATAKAYVAGWSENSTKGSRSYIIRPENYFDYSDSLRYATIEWNRLHPGVPVMWMGLGVNGASVSDFLNNSVYDNGYKYFGDIGSGFNTGVATDMRLILRNDKASIINFQATSDLTNPNYADEAEGLFLNTGLFSGPSYSHLSDLFPNFTFGHMPLSRTISTALDNFTGDPVTDDVSNVSAFRDSQKALLESFGAYTGPALTDMTIEAAGGPHQPNDTEGLPAYLKGSPRVGSRYGLTAAYLLDPTPPVMPRLASRGQFTDGTQTAFTLYVYQGSYGALKNDDVSNEVAGFQVESGGVNNRKGFTATYDGQVVTITKDSGAWVNPKVQYCKGGPLSYGTNYTTEMRADLLKLLYADGPEEGGLGVPINDTGDVQLTVDASLLVEGQPFNVVASVPAAQVVLNPKVQFFQETIGAVASVPAAQILLNTTVVIAQDEISAVGSVPTAFIQLAETRRISTYTMRYLN